MLEPYSIRCLKAIEALYGGREELAKKLGVTTHAIARWVAEGSISKGGVYDLCELQDKFTGKELMGHLDDEKKKRK